MKLVIDTNIIFTQFWPNSSTKKLFNNQNLDLYSPEFSLEEVKKYENEILSKTKISKQEFIKLREELALVINFIPLKDYSKFLKESLKLIPDSNDVDFLALALNLGCSIWSNDQDLKKQNKVTVLTTEELIDLLNS